MMLDAWGSWKIFLMWPSLRETLEGGIGPQNLPSGTPEGETSTGSSRISVFPPSQIPVSLLIMHDFACGSVSLYALDLTVEIWKLGNMCPNPYLDFEGDDQKWAAVEWSFSEKDNSMQVTLFKLCFMTLPGSQGRCVSLCWYSFAFIFISQLFVFYSLWLLCTSCNMQWKEQHTFALWNEFLAQLYIHCGASESCPAAERYRVSVTPPHVPSLVL